ncbi:MAG: hypothetical protein WCT39_06375 [Candidatus Margulisiibacteriota bacterium]
MVAQVGMIRTGLRKAYVGMVRAQMAAGNKLRIAEHYRIAKAIDFTATEGGKIDWALNAILSYGTQAERLDSVPKGNIISPELFRAADALGVLGVYKSDRGKILDLANRIELSPQAAYYKKYNLGDSEHGAITRVVIADALFKSAMRGVDGHGMNLVCGEGPIKLLGFGADDEGNIGYTRFEFKGSEFVGGWPREEEDY